MGIFYLFANLEFGRIISYVFIDGDIIEWLQQKAIFCSIYAQKIRTLKLFQLVNVIFKMRMLFFYFFVSRKTILFRNTK